MAKDINEYIYIYPNHFFVVNMCPLGQSTKTVAKQPQRKITETRQSKK